MNLTPHTSTTAAIRAAALIGELRALGLELKADPEQYRVMYRPKELVTTALYQRIAEAKPAMMALLSANDPDVVWRETLFRERIPAHGAIWPPKLRDTPQTDTPGHCSLCGDELTPEPARRYPRCQPCVRALWLALHAQRETEKAGSL